jgi:hypothetical protein
MQIAIHFAIDITLIKNVNVRSSTRR